MKTFALFRVNFDDERQEQIGHVTLDDASRMTLVSADSAAEPKVQETLAELNAAATLLIKLPPEDGDENASTRKDKYGRDDPRFFDALQDNLRRWHNMELVAE